MQPAGVVGLGEAGDPFGGGGEQDAVPGLAGPDGQADGQVGLAGAWRSKEDDILFAGNVRSVTMLTAGVLCYPTRRFLVTDAVGAGVWAVYAGLIGFLGWAAFEDNPMMGMLLAFGIGLVLAALIEVARRIATRRRPDGTATPNPHGASRPALAYQSA